MNTLAAACTFNNQRERDAVRF